MDTITLEYGTVKKRTIEVKTLPKKWQKWLKAWYTDEDDRTDAQWNEAEAHTFEEMLMELFDEEVYSESVDVLSYE